MLRRSVIPLWAALGGLLVLAALVAPSVAHPQDPCPGGVCPWPQGETELFPLDGLPGDSPPNESPAVPSPAAPSPAMPPGGWMPSAPAPSFGVAPAWSGWGQSVVVRWQSPVIVRRGVAVTAPRWCPPLPSRRSATRWRWR